MTAGCTPVREDGDGSIDAMLADLEELEQLRHEGRGDLAGAIAMCHCDIADSYADFDEDAAAGHWDLADGAAGDDPLLRGEVAEHRGNSAQRRELYEDSRDAFADAAEAYRAAGAWNAYLRCINEHAVQCNRLGRLDDARFTEALTVLAAHPELPATIDHARLWLNSTLSRPPDRASRLRNAIAIYERLEPRSPNASVELARCMHELSGLAPAQRRHLEAGALAVLMPVMTERLAKIQAARIHHGIGLRARTEGRHTDAIPSQNKAAELMFEVCEDDPSLDELGELAAYRGALALALGGARHWVAAVEEGTEAVAELDRVLGERATKFWKTVRDQVAQKLPEWTERRDHVPAPPDRQFRCTFCQRRSGEVFKLISGPGVFICDQCVTESATLVDDAMRSRPVKHQPHPCNFCGVAERRFAISGPGDILLCDDCLGLCVQIVDEERRATQPIET